MYTEWTVDRTCDFHIQSDTNRLVVPNYSDCQEMHTSVTIYKHVFVYHYDMWLSDITPIL